MFRSGNGRRDPKRLACLIAIGLGGIIFLSMFCSVKFLLFLSAIALIGLGTAMLFCIK